jgi:hypothetical protein
MTCCRDCSMCDETHWYCPPWRKRLALVALVLALSVAGCHPPCGPVRDHPTPARHDAQQP